MTNKQKLYLVRVAGGVFLLIGVALLVYYFLPHKILITSYDECVAAGNPAMETFPAQCRVGDKTFTQEVAHPGVKDYDSCLAAAGVILGSNQCLIDGRTFNKDSN